MKNVEYLLGTERLNNNPLIPYDVVVCEYIAEISKILMHDTKAKQYPDVLSFAFWCRKANITQMKNMYADRENRIGRGLIFQIAPSNVPVNFGFSCLFSMLAGNSNIVRIPSKEFIQIDIIIAAFRKALEKFPELSDRIAFIRYQRNDEITEEISKNVDGRVVWGGDATVATVRNIPPKPRCVDLYFPDRYSCAIIDGESIVEADAKILAGLAKNFYNDTFLMDQNACSSPQMIFWVNATEAAKEKFWKAVALYAKGNYYIQSASVIDKFDQSCKDSVLVPQIIKVKTYENIVYRVSLDESVLKENICNLRGSCGYFYECDLTDWKFLSDTINEKYQTMTCFGVDPAVLRDFIINNGVRGVDRVVPIGKAMDIGVIWDGYDIISMLSRVVALQ